MQKKGDITMEKRRMMVLFTFAFLLINLTQTTGEEPMKEKENISTPVKTEKSLDKKDDKGKEAVVATIGNKKITIKELEERLQQIPPQYRATFKGEEKKRLLENIIDRYLLTQEAKNLKIDKIPEVCQKIEDLAANILIQELINREITQKIVITEEEIKKYYDSNLEEFKIPEKIKARHILIKVEAKATPEESAQKEAKAKELLEKIKSGSDFDALAKENSDDSRTKTRGGDLGYLTKGRMSEEFDKVAFTLTPGNVDLIKDHEGYHIIKVDEKKEAKQQTLEEVKTRITNKLKREKQKEMVEALLTSLKNKNKVTINEDLLKQEKTSDEKPVELKPEQPPQVPDAKTETKSDNSGKTGN